jgi:AraC family transcriptional regulator of adaptative response/methylated-DNA-[protein]-cysteine methyltransferase
MVGLPPKGYQDGKRLDRFTVPLERGETVTIATYDVRCGSSSRQYARIYENLGMTPSAFRSGGKGITLRYTTVSRMLVACLWRSRDGVLRL